MKKITFTLLLLISSNCFAASSQINNVVQAGGEPGTATQTLIVPNGNISTLKIVGTGTNSTVASAYYGFASMSSPASQVVYSVANTKTFYVTGMYIQNSASLGQVQFGYATATFTNGTGSAPTGAIYYGASSTVTDSGVRIATTNANPHFYPIFLAFPQNTFPFVRLSNGASDFAMTLEGIEQ